MNLTERIIEGLSTTVDSVDADDACRRLLEIERALDDACEWIADIIGNCPSVDHEYLMSECNGDCWKQYFMEKNG